MSKTRLEKIEGITEEIEQLKKRQKLLQQQHNAQERKARNHRFCKRMGLFESLLPETAGLSDEQFKAFLEKTVANDYGRKALTNVAAQGGEVVTSKTEANTMSSSATVSVKPPETQRQAG